MKRKIIYLICGLCWVIAAGAFALGGLDGANSMPHIFVALLCIVGVFLFLALIVSKRKK